jgi:hypothetical protein
MLVSLLGRVWWRDRILLNSECFTARKYKYAHSLTELSPSWKLPVVQPLKNFPAFYGTEGSLPYSQEPSTGPYPEPYQSSLLISAAESCSRCLATARLEHTYFLRYFGPLGRIPHLSLLILFLILIQSGKRGKWNYTIHGKIVMLEHTHTYIHSLLYR